LKFCKTDFTAADVTSYERNVDTCNSFECLYASLRPHYTSKTTNIEKGDITRHDIAKASV